MAKKNSNTKAFKIKCLPLTQSKRDILWELCVEYAEVYNHVSKFLPSLPEWYWKGKTGHLYKKYVTKGKGNESLKIKTNVLKSSEKLYAIGDATANYKSAIANNKNSRKGLSIQEMKPNVLKFDNKRYEIIKRKNDEYGISINGENIFIPIVIGDFKEARIYLDAAIECGKNPGAITYNFRDNTISIPMSFESEKKFLKKIELSTFIGVDVGVNNSMVLSAIKIESDEPVVKKVEIFSAKELNNRLRQLKKKNDALKSSGKPITNVIRNIQDTTSHQLSRNIVDFALEFDNPVVFFEDLKSMKKNKLRTKSGGNKENKYQRKMIAAWNYAELITKTEYKLKAEGMWMMQIDPRFTSQRCSNCSTIGIRTGSTFHCEACGFGCGSTPQGTIGEMNADVNASINIALKGLFVLYRRKGGRVALPIDLPNENVVNPIPTEMTGTEGTTTVDAVSLKKQAIAACS